MSKNVLLFLFAVSVFCTGTASGQDTGKGSRLTLEVDSLETIRDSLVAIEDSIVAEKSPSATTEDGATLRDTASPYGESITEVPEEASVTALKRKSGYVKVEYENQVGWINIDVAFPYDGVFVPMTSVSAKIASVEEKIEERQKKIRYVNADESDRLARAARNGKVMIGMNEQLVRDAWGIPRDVNRTRTAGRVREQWVYGSIPDRKYVYLTNGEVTSVQD